MGRWFSLALMKLRMVSLYLSGRGCVKENPTFPDGKIRNRHKPIQDMLLSYHVFRGIREKSVYNT